MKTSTKNAIKFLTEQANNATYDSDLWQSGRFNGNCEAFCMCGIISSEQWLELSDLRDKIRDEARQKTIHKIGA